MSRKLVSLFLVVLSILSMTTIAMAEGTAVRYHRGHYRMVARKLYGTFDFDSGFDSFFVYER